jgi:hypothetical protein
VPFLEQLGSQFVSSVFLLQQYPFCLQPLNDGSNRLFYTEARLNLVHACRLGPLERHTLQKSLYDSLFVQFERVPGVGNPLLGIQVNDIFDDRRNVGARDLPRLIFFPHGIIIQILNQALDQDVQKSRIPPTILQDLQQG